MKTLNEIELELSKLGIRNRIFGKPEVRELVNILTDEETITNAANGRYQGGLALIVTTNHRLLLIDKKLWFMSLEDVRFDMITEVDFAARVFDATISVRTINKVLRFTSMHQKNLRDLTRYLQDRILELRQMMIQQAQSPSQALPPQYADQQQPIMPTPMQYTTLAPPPQQQFQEPPVAPQATSLTQDYVTNTAYIRPNRLRRVGAFPTASFTTTHQRYVQARR